MGRTRSREAAAQPAMARSGEHPSGVHTALSGDLWMVDHNGATGRGLLALSQTIAFSLRSALLPTKKTRINGYSSLYFLKWFSEAIQALMPRHGRAR